jgi:uncharacterized membrane protein
MDRTADKGVFYFMNYPPVRIYIYSFTVKILIMDARLLDVIVGLAGFLVLIVMLAVLPMVMVAGAAYLAAIVIFILFLSGAGYLVNDKIT